MPMSMWKRLTRQAASIAHERGATAVEYTLMIALIALVIFGAATALGLTLPDLFRSAADGIRSG